MFDKSGSTVVKIRGAGRELRDKNDFNKLLQEWVAKSYSTVSAVVLQHAAHLIFVFVCFRSMAYAKWIF